LSKTYMVLYGKNSVAERLKANPGSIQKIFLEDTFDPSGIDKLIKINKIPVEHVSRQGLSKTKNAKDLQGITARVNAFEYISFDELLDRPKEKRLTLIFLDRINDPQNLGVIIRTAACFGGFAVIIPRHEACEVTETVLHVASGGENYVPVSKVPNLSGAIIAAKAAGYWILGTVVTDDAEDINKISLPFPLGVVLGSEGEGIRYGIEKHLDIKARIPMHGAKLSFNVNIACAIFCHEISKQREHQHEAQN